MRCIFSSIDVTVLQCGLRMTLTTVVRVSRCILFLQGDAISMLLSARQSRVQHNGQKQIIAICVAE